MPEEPEPTEEELEERLRRLLAEGELAGDPELEELELKLRDVEGKLKKCCLKSAQISSQETDGSHTAPT